MDEERIINETNECEQEEHCVMFYCGRCGTPIMTNEYSCSGCGRSVDEMVKAANASSNVWALLSSVRKNAKKRIEAAQK